MARPRTTSDPKERPRILKLARKVGVRVAAKQLNIRWGHIQGLIMSEARLAKAGRRRVARAAKAKPPRVTKRGSRRLPILPPTPGTSVLLGGRCIIIPEGVFAAVREGQVTLWAS